MHIETCVKVLVREIKLRKVVVHNKLLVGDASNFVLDERFGLVVSTYDSLNHLEDEFALQKCFR